MNRLVVSALACAAAVTAVGAVRPPEPFKNGETVVFMGDSITHCDWYVTDIQLFWALRHPGSGVRVLNAGRSGDSAWGALGRYDEEVLPDHPDRVFVMFGMNDVGREKWTDNDTSKAASRAWNIQAYTSNTRTLLGKVRTNGSEPVLMTPSPFDQYGDYPGNPTTPHCNDGLAICASVARGFADEFDCALVDLHAPLTAMCARNAFCTEKPALFCGSDRVHPGEAGHLAMAAIVLEALGENGVVADVKKNARGKAGIDFTYAPKALPYPVTPAYCAAQKFWPVTEKLNREMLTVENLAPGDYELRFDGRLAGVFSAAEFASGVNLALLDTPNARLAKKAAEIADALHVCVDVIRTLTNVKAGARNDGADISDPASVIAAMEKSIAKMHAKNVPWVGYYESTLKLYREKGAEEPAIIARAEACRAALDAIRPVKSHVVIRRRGDEAAAFLRANADKSLNKIPVRIAAENIFLCAGDGVFTPEGEAAELAAHEKFYAESTYNLLTYSLRCKNDLNDEATRAHVKKVVDTAHVHGVQVMMDADPRIARHAFLARWPNECQQVAFVLSAQADAKGVAVVDGTAGPLEDHMSCGSKRPYEATAVRLAAPAASDTVKAEIVAPSRIRVTASGLKPGETFTCTVLFDLYSCDVFSPHLLPYIRDVMDTYKKLGVDGAMRDEWGFPPSSYGEMQIKEHRVFWYSPHFESAYRTRTGRSLLKDLPLMALGEKGSEADRFKAIGDYMALVFNRNAEIERDFYAYDKKLYGEDMYCTKHPTWWPALAAGEALHNGFDWWAADRDWAQSDEVTPVPAVLGMAKKFGGAVWMNEGYQTKPERYANRVWTYALCGGRMVWHPVYPRPESWNKLPAAEVRLRGTLEPLEKGARVAQNRVRLLNAVSQAQLDCRVAVVFSHELALDWSGFAGDTWCRWGEAIANGLWAKGYPADVYPGDELYKGAFRVDAEGYLRVGAQTYDAVVLVNPSGKDRDVLYPLRWAPKTRFFERNDKTVDEVAAHLDALRAVKQPPCSPEHDVDGCCWSGVYPATEGTITLQDGTVAVMKGCLPDPEGDPIAGMVNVGGAWVEYEAKGLFAARLGADGRLAVAAGGALKRAKGPGIDWTGDGTRDLVLFRDGDSVRVIEFLPTGGKAAE